jgi:putative component of membrane protein insertase Oxa1/YidC/SpoIIIJ protein YidD
MKWAFLAVIKLYWKVFPENKRRSCLFKETCSHYVYRHTIEQGFFSGVNALKLRLKKCRKGYQLYSGRQGFEMKLADGSIINEEEISPNILNPIHRQVQLIIEQVQITNDFLQTSDTKT